MTGPVIEPTDAMVAAFERAGTGGYGDITDTRAGLTAAFALLARDYTITPKQTPQVATECVTCCGDIGLWNPPNLATGYTHIRPGGGPDWDLNKAHAVVPGDFVPFPPDWTAKPAAAPQCPACTSPYTYHRFVLPVMDPISHTYAGDQQCSDPWHDADAVTSGTYTAGPSARTCPGLIGTAGEGFRLAPAPCGRDTAHDQHPLDD